MAKIPDNSFKQWRDAETISATDYVKEREVLRVATNDNDTRIKTLETDVDAVEIKANDLDTRLSTVENVSDTALREDLDAHEADTTIHLGSIDRNIISKTAYIEEEGSNGNGTYIKYSNGTLMCWQYRAVESTAIGAWDPLSLAGQTYYSMNSPYFTSWTYPHPFLSGSAVSCHATGDISGLSIEIFNAFHIDHTKCTTNIAGWGANVSGRGFKQQLFAVGKWK
jgi:hypothetical protein